MRYLVRAVLAVAVIATAGFAVGCGEEEPPPPPMQQQQFEQERLPEQGQPLEAGPEAPEEDADQTIPEGTQVPAMPEEF